MILERCGDKRRPYAGCVFGHAEIGPVIKRQVCLFEEMRGLGIYPPKSGRLPAADECWPSPDGLAIKVKGTGIRCNKTNDGWECRAFTATGTRDLTPGVIAPDLGAVLTKPPLPDTDGYGAKNRDGTYYVHDPAAVVHEPVFRWKDHRAATIGFGWDAHQYPHPLRQHPQQAPLANETGLQCSGNRCLMELSHRGVSDSHWDLGNGEGLTVYNATGYGLLGLHAHNYTVTAYNLGLPINSTSNQTDAMIADYAPVYDRHAYPVLRDGGRHATTTGRDRHALPRVMGERHRRRRGAAPGQALQGQRVVPQHHGALRGEHRPAAAGRPSLLAWHSAGHVNGTDPGAFHSTGDGHAMFEGAGYGIVRLWQGLSGIVLDGDGRRNLYANVTTLNTVASDGFAGHGSYGLFNYTYRYPHAPLAMWYNMTLHGPDGAAVQGVRMSVEATVLRAGGQRHPGARLERHGGRPVRPDAAGGVTVAEVDAYMYAKSLRDTGDPHLAAAARDDAYGMGNAAAGGEGDGTLGMWLNRTGLEFRAGYAVPPGQA